MNARFEYLYRDAGNYKLWGEVIFTNQKNINIDSLESQIKEMLIDGEFFIAGKSGLPKLAFQKHDDELDHDWNEFCFLEETAEPANDVLNRDITEFFESFKQAVEL